MLELNWIGSLLTGQRISTNPADGSTKAWKWSDGTNWNYFVWHPNESNTADQTVSHITRENNLVWNDWEEVLSNDPLTAIYKRVNCNTIAIHLFKST